MPDPTQQQTQGGLEVQLAETRTALQQLINAYELAAQQHHDTLKNSRLHDPEHIEQFYSCKARPCHRADIALTTARKVLEDARSD